MKTMAAGGLFLASLSLAALAGAYVSSKRPQPGAKDPASGYYAKDEALRALLGVKGMNLEYTLPRDEPYYYITFIKFEDGKRVAAGGGISNDPTGAMPRSRDLHLQFLWKEDNEKTILAESGMWGMFPDPFWQKLDFGCSTAHSSYEGYTVLGFATSRLLQKGSGTPGGTSDFQFELKDKRYVGAVVIKTFKTKKELEEFRGLKSVSG